MEDLGRVGRFFSVRPEISASSGVRTGFAWISEQYPQSVRRWAEWFETASLEDLKKLLGFLKLNQISTVEELSILEAGMESYFFDSREASSDPRMQMMLELARSIPNEKKRLLESLKQEIILAEDLAELSESLRELLAAGRALDLAKESTQIVLDLYSKTKDEEVRHELRQTGFGLYTHYHAYFGRVDRALVQEYLAQAVQAFEDSEMFVDGMEWSERRLRSEIRSLIAQLPRAQARELEKLLLSEEILSEEDSEAVIESLDPDVARDFGHPIGLSPNKMNVMTRSVLFLQPLTRDPQSSLSIRIRQWAFKYQRLQEIVSAQDRMAVIQGQAEEFLLRYRSRPRPAPIRSSAVQNLSPHFFDEQAFQALLKSEIVKNLRDGRFADAVKLAESVEVTPSELEFFQRLWDFVDAPPLVFAKTSQDLSDRLRISLPGMGIDDRLSVVRLMISRLHQDPSNYAEEQEHLVYIQDSLEVIESDWVSMDLKTQLIGELIRVAKFQRKRPAGEFADSVLALLARSPAVSELLRKSIEDSLRRTEPVSEWLPLPHREFHRASLDFSGGDHVPDRDTRFEWDVFVSKIRRTGLKEDDLAWAKAYLEKYQIRSLSAIHRLQEWLGRELRSVKIPFEERLRMHEFLGFIEQAVHHSMDRQVERYLTGNGSVRSEVRTSLGYAVLRSAHSVEAARAVAEIYLKLEAGDAKKAWRQEIQLQLIRLSEKEVESARGDDRVQYRLARATLRNALQTDP